MILLDEFSDNDKDNYEPELKSHLEVSLPAEYYKMLEAAELNIPAGVLSPLEFPLNMKWTCFWDDCKYHINLFKLTDDNLSGLQPDDKQYLQSKNYNISDTRFGNLWTDMVQNHYWAHFAKMGVEVVAFRKPAPGVEKLHHLPTSRIITVPNTITEGDNVSIIQIYLL